MKDYPVLAEFPKERLRINSTGALSLPMMGGVILGIIAVGLFILWLGLPGILMDKRIGNDPVAVDADVGGECSTRYFISHCDVTLTYDMDGASHTAKRSFWFFDSGGGNYTVDVLALADDPTQVTVDLAIEKLANRSLMLFCGAGLAFLLAGLAVRNLIFRVLPLARIGKGQSASLQPVVLEISPKEKGRQFTYEWNDRGEKRKFVTKFTASENGPFVLGLGGNGNIDVLGVVAQDTQTAILLDEGLTRIQLTEEQRKALYQANAGTAEETPQS